MKKLKYGKGEITLEGILRMIEGMLIYALDKASISTKFKNKKKTRRVISDKRKQVLETKEWVGGENWHIWLNIYSTEAGVDERRIRNNFKKRVKVSLAYLTRARNKIKRKKK